MIWQPLPLPDGSYSDATKAWADQDVVCFLPTPAEAQGTRSPTKYVPTPGLEVFASVGDGPHRGARDVEGKLFVVSGSALYQVATDGTATSRGTIPGTGRVSMTHNQVAGGNQLVIGTVDNSYVYDTTTATLTATGVPLQSVDFLGQLVLGIEPQRRFWRYSGLADATSWNTLDNESAESSPDRLVGGIVSQGEWLAFGERTIEVFSNTPTEDTAFQRSAVIERGCANGATLCRLDNSVFFVDNNKIPCRLQGYTPVPIAPKAIISALAECDPRKMFAFTWEDRGYVVYYVTCQDGQTFGYDVSSQRWHRRESLGLDRWRINTVFKWNGEWFAGDYRNGKLYRLAWDFMYEGCELMPRRIRSGVLHGNGNRVTVHGLRIPVAAGGVPSEVTAETPPTITGALPDGYVGDAVSYTYTITKAFPGQEVTLTVSGDFPPGLSIDSAGHITGTPTTGGTYAFTITPSSECAEGEALSESVVIADTISSAILADAPILYWKLNETDGTTIADYSGYGRNGTVTGSPTLSGSGITLDGSSGQGVYYPGDAGGSVLDVGGDTTWAIEAVVTRTGNGGSVWETIAGQFRSPNFGYMNSLLACAGNGVPADRGKPTGYFSDAAAPSNSYGVSAPTALANGARTHLMAIRRPGTGGLGRMELWENGVLVATSTSFSESAVGIASNGAKFLVGSDSDTANYYPASYAFNGKIAHVAVYDTTVSAERALYHAQVLGLA